MPSGTSFQSTYIEDTNISKSLLMVVTKVVQDYNASDNPGRFEVRSSASGRIETIGTSRDSTHTPVDVLDKHISFRSVSLGSLDALNRFVSLLSAATGTNIVGWRNSLQLAKFGEHQGSARISAGKRHPYEHSGIPRYATGVGFALRLRQPELFLELKTFPGRSHR